MASPVEIADSPQPQEECQELQVYNQVPDTAGVTGVLPSCIFTEIPPKEVVSTTTTTTTSTITDSSGRVKKLKTTTTTTLRTTTTVRRVCVVAPATSTAIASVTDEQTHIPEGAVEIAGSPTLPALPEDLKLPSIGNSEVVRLTHVSGDEVGPNQGRNITQVTFVKPQTQTSEIVKVHTDDRAGEDEATSGCGQAKRTTKTVRKRVTTSVAAVFSSRHTKVDGKSESRNLRHDSMISPPGESFENLDHGASAAAGALGEGGLELSGEDNAAILALRECERQFATRLGVSRHPSTDSGTTIVDCVTSANGKTTTTTTTRTFRGAGFPSLFDGLPLYQGYGMITQHVKAVNPSAAPFSIFFDETLDTIDASSIAKMLEEATKTSLLSKDLNSLFGDLTTTGKPAIGGSGVVIEEVKPDDSKAAEDSALTTHEATDRGTSVQSMDRTSGVEDTAAAAAAAAATSPTTITTTGAGSETVGYKNQILNQLATKTGPCRIAWSEMPEVQSANLVASLTRHEIQLQEAMFEVITSEASYYRSLQVLIEHFYSAPEFDCSHTTSASMEAPSAGADNDPEAVPHPSAEGRVSISANTSANNARAGSISTPPDSVSMKPVLSPTEKHHLFSNVLLICMASERFLQDLESRWSSQKPLLTEVCDLIVKYAGGVQFDHYLTYLRNQTYQVAAYRRLNRREDFQKAIARMHAHPAVGKNRLDSFLALPMQRLTRLKLIVEVILKLQTVVASEAAASAAEETAGETTDGKDLGRRMKITSEQVENSTVALRELKRLLSESESEKKLMDEKARLLALSSALEFPENVKRIAISDKRLIKEGELKSASSDGRATVFLKKLGRKKPETFYLILFHDLLMVTKLKKNDRYLVQDYCPRDKVYVTISNPSETMLNALAPTTARAQVAGANSLGGLGGGSRRQKRSSTSILGLKGGPRHHTTTPEVPDCLFKNSAELALHPTLAPRSSLSSSATEVCVAVSPASPPLSPSRLASIRLKRSGSSLSSKSVPPATSYTSPASTINRDLPLLLYICLTQSQSGACTEFCLTTNDSSEYEAWYRALHLNSLKPNNLDTATEAEAEVEAEEVEEERTSG